MKITINKKVFVATLITGYQLMVSQALAQNVIGSIKNPLPKYTQTNGGGLFQFITNVLKTAGTVAGIYMVFQLIMAGYSYVSASGDPKKAEAAWATIWQSLLGMVIIASAFAIAAVVEKLTGISILTPYIYGPGP